MAVPHEDRIPVQPDRDVDYIAPRDYFHAPSSTYMSLEYASTPVHYTRDQAAISLLLDTTESVGLRQACARELIRSGGHVLIPEERLVHAILGAEKPEMVATLLALFDRTDNDCTAASGLLFTFHFSPPNWEMRTALVEILPQLQGVGERIIPILVTLGREDRFAPWVVQAHRLAEQLRPGLWDQCDAFITAGKAGKTSKETPSIPEEAALQIRFIVDEWRNDSIENLARLTATGLDREFLYCAPFIFTDNSMTVVELESVASALLSMSLDRIVISQVMTEMVGHLDASKSTRVLAVISPTGLAREMGPVDTLVERMRFGTKAEREFAVDELVTLLDTADQLRQTIVFEGFKEFARDCSVEAGGRTALLWRLARRGQAEQGVFETFVTALASDPTASFVNEARDAAADLIALTAMRPARERSPGSAYRLSDFARLLLPGDRNGSCDTERLNDLLRIGDVQKAFAAELRTWSLHYISNSVRNLAELRTHCRFGAGFDDLVQQGCMTAVRFVWLFSPNEEFAEREREVLKMREVCGGRLTWTGRLQRTLIAFLRWRRTTEARTSERDVEASPQ